MAPTSIELQFPLQNLPSLYQYVYHPHEQQIAKHMMIIIIVWVPYLHNIYPHIVCDTSQQTSHSVPSTLKGEWVNENKIRKQTREHVDCSGL